MLAGLVVALALIPEAISFSVIAGVVHSVTGELFFASSNDLVGRFDYTGDPDKVVIDLSAAHVWDASSVAALDAIGTKYAQRGKDVEIIGLNDPSADLHGRLTGELAGGH